MKAIINPAAVLFFALLGATAAHGTKAYKWVDERGVTHFSATPPEAGKPSETIHIRTSEPGTDTGGLPPRAEPTAPQTSARPESLSDQVYRQQDQTLCNQARETDAALADAGQVQVREDGGDYRVLDADELEEWRERARADIRRHCR